MQQPKRFQAATLPEAYEKVRAELGADAVILSTRKAYAPGLFGQPGREFVEVVAHVPRTGESLPSGTRPALDQDIAAHEMLRAVAESAAAAPTTARVPRKTAVKAAVKATPAAPAPRAAAAKPKAMSTSAPSVAAAVPAGSNMLAQQLDQMRSMLETLISERTSKRLDGAPGAGRDLRDQLILHGLSARLAATVAEEAAGAVVRDGDEEALARTAERKIVAKMPRTAMPAFGRRPLAIFLVGPGGSGKTSMAVRLGLELEQAHGLRVALAGTDVNRAGAPQQLLAYGSATGLPVHLCYAPEELDLLMRSGNADVVIVDTPGHNGLQRERMAELDAYLGVARQRVVLMTVPATMKAADLSESVASFGTAGVDGLVATRCDETSHFGALMDAAVGSGIGFAYTTHSDQVTEAARPADNFALARALVTARWPVAATAATRLAPQRLTRVG